MILVGSFLFGMFYKLIDLGRAACPLGMGRRSCRETLRVCSLSSGAVIEAWGKIIENPTSGVNKYKKITRAGESSQRTWTKTCAQLLKS